MTTKTTAAAPEKSASEVLIEQLAAEKLREAINPMAVIEAGPVEGEETPDGLKIIERTKFANGAVLETFA